MHHVVNELNFKEHFYKRIIGKRPFYDLLCIIPLQNSMVKRIGCHNMTFLYLNQRYNKVCYQGTALYYF